jgi:hypothetical protein
MTTILIIQNGANSVPESLPYLSYLLFGIEAVISLFYAGGCIALAVLLSKHHVFRQSGCVVASQADAVFAALSYMLWTASATVHGIEISELRRRVELTDKMQEKIVGEV